MNGVCRHRQRKYIVNKRHDFTLMRLRKLANANIIASPTGAERNDDAADLEVQRLQTTEELTLAADFDFLRALLSWLSSRK